MQSEESPPDNARRTEINRWYDEDDEFAAPDSRNTDLDTVPELADIEYDDESVDRGIGLSFLIERSMLDPHAAVIPRDEP